MRGVSWTLDEESCPRRFFRVTNIAVYESKAHIKALRSKATDQEVKASVLVDSESRIVPEAHM